MAGNVVIQDKWIGNSPEELIDYYSASPLTSGNASVGLKGSIYPWLKKKCKRKEFQYFDDSDGNVDFLCLNDANDYLNKGIYALLCYKYLQLGGYWSWSTVTFYYPRFYLNLALCRLQGNVLFSGGPPVEIFRDDWDNRTYGYIIPPIKGGTHSTIWERTKTLYKKFNLKDFSKQCRDVGFIMDYDKHKAARHFDFKDLHEERRQREKITYSSGGFEELHWTPDYCLPIIQVLSEGEKNLIDPEVFAEETNVEDYDGTGIEERGMGILLQFTIELFGMIAKSVDKKGEILQLRCGVFTKLKTNDDTLDLIKKWSNDAGLRIN